MTVYSQEGWNRRIGLLVTGNLKLTFPTAAAALQLAWGVVSLPPSAVVDEQVYEHLNWTAQYLIACRLTPDSLVSQVVLQKCPSLVQTYHRITKSIAISGAS